MRGAARYTNMIAGLLLVALSVTAQAPAPAPGADPLVCPRAGNPSAMGGFNNLTVDSNIQQLGNDAWGIIFNQNGANVPADCVDVARNNAQVNVTSACSQVVAGTNYILNMRVTIPGCNVGSDVVANVFTPLNGGAPTVNNYNVGPWTPLPTPTPLPAPKPAPTPKSAPAPAPGPSFPLVCPRAGSPTLSGGFANTTVTDDIQKYGQQAWTAIVASNGANVPIGCLDVNNAQVNVTSACSQVVAGTNYILNMRVTIPGCNLVNNNVVANYFVPLPSSNAMPALNNYAVGSWQAGASPSPLPSSPAPDNTKLLTCPNATGAPGGWSNSNVSDPQLKALATASWTLITIQNGTGLPDGKCDTSKADITVLSACSQLVSGTIYIITYNVKLASCNLQSNVTVNMLVPPRTTDQQGPVLNAYNVGPWVAMPAPSPSPAVPSPSPAVPSPSPKPPPPCPLKQQPFCRAYVRGATCCQQQGISVNSLFTDIMLVCSANVKLPQPKCLNVTGPVNVTAASVNWGGTPDFGDMASYAIDWRNSTFAPGVNAPFNGTVVVDYESLRSKDSDCDLRLAEPCLLDNTVYTKAAPVNATRINVVGNTTQLSPVPTIAWPNATLGANGCLSQTYLNIPTTFFSDKGAITFTNGTGAQQCNPVP